MYKRNQIEEAISRLAGEKSAAPSSELRTRLKRLLDLDRNLGRNVRSNDPEKSNYAFYSEDAPGRGVEVWFSAYEAFALSLGIRLLEHGWPQSLVVTTLRRLRPKLEAQHTRFLKQDPKELFDQEALWRDARPGDIAFDNTDPVVLAVVSSRRDRSENGPLNVDVCHGLREAGEFLRSQQASSWSFHELVTPGHRLSEYLNKIPPRQRGRSS